MLRPPLGLVKDANRGVLTACNPVYCTQLANAEPNTMPMRRRTKVETESFWTDVVERHPGTRLTREYPSAA